MIYVLYALHVLVCVFLILVVLLQQGKGADLSVFGGGSTQTAFGARGATTLLHKLTVASFVIFTLTTLSIGILQGGRGGASVMSDVMEERAEQQTNPAPVQPAPVQGQTPGQPQGKTPAEAPEQAPTQTPQSPAQTPAEPPAGQPQ